MFTHAVTRKPGKNFAAGQTRADLGAPRYELICEQHAAYIDTLKRLDLAVTELDPLDSHPDAYFVEDPAIVTPRVAIITIPGARSRQGEQDSLEEQLKEHRSIARIQPPGTVDGGDVLMVHEHFFIGVSNRTNPEGARQLAAILQDHGYTWSTVTVEDGLHLKSDVNYIGGNRLLISERYASHRQFGEFDKIVVKPDESYAANTLLINDCLLTPRGFPDTREKLGVTGMDIIDLDMSEVRKMDGGLTCLSLRF